MAAHRGRKFEGDFRKGWGVEAWAPDGTAWGSTTAQAVERCRGRGYR